MFFFGEGAPFPWGEAGESEAADAGTCQFSYFETGGLDEDAHFMLFPFGDDNFHRPFAYLSH